MSLLASPLIFSSRSIVDPPNLKIVVYSNNEQPEQE